MHTRNPETGLPLVSAAWLAANLSNQRLRVIDASWHLPATNRDACAEFHQTHIPGAVFFDIDENSSHGDLPHMMPDPEQFARAAGRLGISENDVIVVYDSIGIFSSARVWWMFRHFGARQVYVLDGGLPAWTRSGGTLESSDSSGYTRRSDSFESASEATRGYPAQQFLVSATPEQRCAELADLPLVQRAMRDSSVIIMDARSAARFTGAEQEVRPGLRSGHIPGSINLPFSEVLTGQGTLKDVPELEALFHRLGVRNDSHVITTCGSGVTAAILVLALTCSGFDRIALYDGSWSEWGAPGKGPVATGA